MGPTWGRQDPGGPHVAHVKLAIWDILNEYHYIVKFKTYDVHQCFPFPDPNVSLPMAEIFNGVLQGSVSGTVVGTVTITSRNMDSGIEFDGVSGYVDFGMHDGKCFHSPNACNAGVTFALWLWAGDNPRSVIVLDSGGFTAGKAGYCLKLSRSVLHVVVKLVSNNGKHHYKLDGWNQDRWEHIVWMWHPAQGIRFFLNGCDTDPGATKGRSSYTVLNKVELSNQVSFVLGARARGFRMKANMKIDDLYIWNQVLTENEVWRAYVNGGMMASEIGWCVPVTGLL